MITFPDTRVLASGRLAFIASDGTVELADCGWTVSLGLFEGEEAFADCGAPMRVHPDYPQGWRCDHGHQHRGVEVEWAEDALVEQLVRAGLRPESDLL